MLLWLALGWWLGGFVALATERGLDPSIGVCALLVATGVATYGRSLQARSWGVALASLALVASLCVRTAPPRIPERTQSAHFEGKVVGARFGPDRAWIDVDVRRGRFDSGQRLALPLRVRIRTEIEASIPPGCNVRFSGQVRPARRFRNRSRHPTWPGTGPGARAVLRATHALMVTACSGWRWTFHREQQRIRAFLLDTLPDQTSSIVRALVLGDGAAIDRAQRKSVASAGLAHLLAVSGLHIAMVSGLCVGLLRAGLLWCTTAANPTRIAAAVGAPLALAHAVFAGGAPSAWRAAVTASISWMLVALGRRPSPRHVMAAAVIVLCGHDPLVATRPAFLLSVAATAAIVTAMPAPARRWRAIRAAHTMSWRTLLATAPIVWWCFGDVPIIGWWTNIFVLPLAAGVLVPLSNLYALSAHLPALSFVAQPLDTAVSLLIQCCEFITSTVPSLALPPLTLPSAPIVVATVIAILSLRGRSDRVRILCAGAIALLALHAWPRDTPTQDTLRATFVDVGQGDAAIVDLPDGRVMLVDAGPGEYGAGEALLTLLRARGVDHIDLAIVSHGHPDHYRGIPYLLEHITIDELWTHGQTIAEQPDGEYGRLLHRLQTQSVTIVEPAPLCEAPVSFGRVTLEVLAPCPRYDPGLGLNDNSLVVRLTFEGHSILFTGDAERDRESQLAEQLGARLSSDVLKVGHHGSRTSTTASFLSAVNPVLAVISSGTGNQFDHPHPSVLEALKARGVTTVRTDKEGDITVTLDKEGIHWSSWRRRRPHPVRR